MSKFLFRDGTLNLPFTQSPKQHKQDLNTARRHRVDILGLQEIQTAASKKAVRQWLRRHPLWGVRWGGECPILFKRTKFKVVGHQVFTTDPGLAGVNPCRVINTLGLVHRKSRKYLYYANHHAEHEYTLNHKDSPHYNYKVEAAKRGLVMLKNLGADRVGGDFNAPRDKHNEDWYPYSFSINYTLNASGLDYIGWWTNFWYVRNKQVIPVNSDHNLLLVDVYR